MKASGAKITALLLALTVSATALGQEPDADPTGAEVERLDTGPEYAVGFLRSPCFGLRCGPFAIYDVSYRGDGGVRVEANDPSGIFPAPDLDTNHQGGLRLLVGDRVFAGGEWSQNRKQAAIGGTRFDLSYVDDDGKTATAELRLRRWRLRSEARHRPDTEGGGWTLAGEVGLRLGPALEIVVEGGGEARASETGPFAVRPEAGGGGSVIWIPSALHALRVGVAYTRLRGGADETARRFSGTASWEALFTPVEIGARLEYRHTSGSFGADDVAGEVEIEGRLADRWIAEVAWREAGEVGLASTARSWRAGISLFTAYASLDREGVDSQLVTLLTERLWEMGINEERTIGVDNLRALRERLFVSARRDELLPVLEELHTATIAERNVQTFGVEVSEERDFVLGSRVRGVSVFLGVPWPATAPWVENSDATDFLSLVWTYREADLNPGVTEIGRQLVLTAELNRELALRIGWEVPLRSALDVVTGSARGERLFGEVRYAFGR